MSHVIVVIIIAQCTYYTHTHAPVIFVSFLPRGATQSAVMRLHVVCLSVRLSVCLSVRP